ncbi:MAG: hypothetical protein H9W81_03315 [Enterococcus sp.]|nr:hypothetical protein [Enterococcus sp.]
MAELFTTRHLDVLLDHLRANRNVWDNIHGGQMGGLKKRYHNWAKSIALPAANAYAETIEVIQIALESGVEVSEAMTNVPRDFLDRKMRAMVPYQEVYSMVHATMNQVNGTYFEQRRSRDEPVVII